MMPEKEEVEEKTILKLTRKFQSPDNVLIYEERTVEINAAVPFNEAWEKAYSYVQNHTNILRTKITDDVGIA